MKVLYLTYDGLSDPLGQSQVLPYLSGLSQNGHDITIVSFEKKETLSKQFTRLEEELKEKKIHWIILTYTKRPPVLSTIFDIIKLRIKCFQLQRQNHYQSVHCRSYITSFIGLQLQKKFRLKFIFDMRGFYADERVDGGLWNQKKVIYRIIYQYFKRKEASFILSANKIVALTYAAKKILSDKFPSAESKISVIPCCVDTQLFDPEKIDPAIQQALKNKVSIKEDTFVLSYLGGLGTWYLLDDMLDFYKRVLQNYSSSKFLFITQNPEKEILDAALRKNINVENIIVLKASRSEVPLFLSLSTVSIFFIMPSFSKMASSPTKQAEVLAMGIPIVCNTNIGDTEFVINKSAAGVLVDKFTDEAFDQAIGKIPLLLKKDKAEIRMAGIDMFSLTNGVAAYQKIYAELENKNV